MGSAGAAVSATARVAAALTMSMACMYEALDGMAKRWPHTRLEPSPQACAELPWILGLLAIFAVVVADSGLAHVWLVPWL